MSEPFLIAHKVRGEPAFDVAIRMDCPLCIGSGLYDINEDGSEVACVECDSTGFWWIIPTSGHRAYPYYNIELSEFRIYDGETYYNIASEPEIDAGMPPSLPDHYPTASSSRPSLDLAQLIPPVKIQRRF